MTGDREDANARDEKIIAALYEEAEQTRLPYEAPYDTEAESQRFSTWLDGTQARSSSPTRLEHTAATPKSAAAAVSKSVGATDFTSRVNDAPHLAVPADNTYPVADQEPLSYRAAHWAVVITGRPSRRARLLPGFLIVGAERCGTTSLFHVLRQHPAVFNAILPKKEVHYFDVAYGRGLGWYQSHFPLTTRARLTARRAGLDPVAFESSPYYMFHPLAPGRIHRDLPGVKLIVLVRDPVERAYSAHANHVSHGLETEPFERALELEDTRMAGEAERLAADPGYRSYNHRHFSYRTRGYYADQLEHLERIFGRDRIHVIDSGDFFTAPGPAYDRVLDFLGLPRRGQPAFTPQNARPRSPMPASLRAALDDHYQPYDERLARWLGGPPSWRR